MACLLGNKLAFLFLWAKRSLNLNCSEILSSCSLCMAEGEGLSCLNRCVRLTVDEWGRGDGIDGGDEWDEWDTEDVSDE